MAYQPTGQALQSASTPFDLLDKRLAHILSTIRPFAFWPYLLTLLTLTSLSAPTAAVAQLSGIGGGWVLHIIGMVQVEPGSNVMTLRIKEDVIRFAVNDIDTRDQNFSTPQFLSEARRREPSLELRGSEELLNMLLKERPGKRVLKLTGRYYQDSRRFMLDAIDRLGDNPTLR